MNPAASNSAKRKLVMFIIFGIVFTAIGMLGFLSMQIDSSWEQTEGRVIEIIDSMNDGKVIHTPVHAYEVNGKTYHTESSGGYSKLPQIGDTTVIYYDPAKPSNSKENHGLLSYFILIFSIAGIFMLIAGPLRYIKAKSSQANPSVNNNF